MWGATITIVVFLRDSNYFNPRAPCGARPEFLFFADVVDIISIHAPRVGRDWTKCEDTPYTRISIHAPRVGRDGKDVFLTREEAEFQSTRPVWGAT